MPGTENTLTFSPQENAKSLHDVHSSALIFYNLNIDIKLTIINIYDLYN